MNRTDAEAFCDYYNSIKYELPYMQQEIWEDEIKMIRKKFFYNEF